MIRIKNSLLPGQSVSEAPFQLLLKHKPQMSFLPLIGVLSAEVSGIGITLPCPAKQYWSMLKMSPEQATLHLSLTNFEWRPFSSLRTNKGFEILKGQCAVSLKYGWFLCVLWYLRNHKCDSHSFISIIVLVQSIEKDVLSMMDTSEVLHHGWYRSFFPYSHTHRAANGGKGALACPGSLAGKTCYIWGSCPQPRLSMSRVCHKIWNPNGSSLQEAFASMMLKLAIPSFLPKWISALYSGFWNPRHRVMPCFYRGWPAETSQQGWIFWLRDGLFIAPEVWLNKACQGSTFLHGRWRAGLSAAWLGKGQRQGTGSSSHINNL